MQIYRFRNCLLNTLERRVIKDGKYLEITPRTFDLLQLLVERCGEIVTKNEMLGTLWNGSFVEEGNLSVHVYRLRRSLGETHYEHYIETSHGNGYRFVAKVVSVTHGVWNRQISHRAGSMAIVKLKKIAPPPELRSLTLTRTLPRNASMRFNLVYDEDPKRTRIPP